MPTMNDALQQATQQLERAVEGLSAGPEAQEGSETVLAICLQSLDGARQEAEQMAAGSLDLVRLEARSAENLDLARLALQRQEGASGSKVGTLKDALFHTRRALDYLQRFAELVTERTRVADRERNQKEFMAG